MYAFTYILGCEKWSMEIIELFIDNGTDVEKYGKQLYKKAKNINNIPSVQYIRSISE